ncbi:LysM peptidoglycan-binding domain-containing protein [Rhizorhabdus sp. FW153]|uniref:LysM peptidoglycan-binding domain-containing protein n=1 Tax=Rhizorhabdus sp. FW153 TaxID=3400216 RepID=UPI003CF1E503
MDFHHYGNDAHLGAIGNDGAPEYGYRNAIDHRYDTASTTAFRYGSAQSFVDFDQSYEMINPISQNGTSSAYTVQAGDTLQTLALVYWGDSSLWYLIAYAKGLSGSETLVAGTSLWVPSRVANVHNTASTFKPYDPNEAQVNTDPLAPSPKKAKKCGGLGAVILAAVAVAVTAIATAGIGALATGASFSSIASQGLGIAMGLQSKFSFKEVALAAIAGGISGGIGQSSLFSSLGPVGGAIARGTVANVATQGIGVATGLQNRFNWAGVAPGAAPAHDN